MVLRTHFSSRDITFYCLWFPFLDVRVYRSSNRLTFSLHVKKILHKGSDINNFWYPQIFFTWNYTSYYGCGCQSLQYLIYCISFCTHKLIIYTWSYQVFAKRCLFIYQIVSPRQSCLNVMILSNTLLFNIHLASFNGPSLPYTKEVDMTVLCSRQPSKINRKLEIPRFKTHVLLKCIACVYKSLPLYLDFPLSPTHYNFKIGELFWNKEGS